MGAEIEMNVNVDDEWMSHETYREVEEQERSVKNFYIWMLGNETYDSDESEQQCRKLTFRIKQVQANGSN